MLSYYICIDAHIKWRMENGEWRIKKGRKQKAEWRREKAEGRISKCIRGFLHG
jgi:hypothetical protein